MTYEIRISTELLVESLTTGYELNGLLRVTKGLPAGCRFVGVLANEIGSSDLRLLFASAEDGPGWDVSGVQMLQISDASHLIEPSVRAIALLKQAEIDCRGYEALHSWVEPAAELLGGLGML